MRRRLVSGDLEHGRTVASVKFGTHHIRCEGKHDLVHVMPAIPSSSERDTHVGEMIVMEMSV